MLFFFEKHVEKSISWLQIDTNNYKKVFIMIVLKKVALLSS